MLSRIHAITPSSVRTSLPTYSISSSSGQTLFGRVMWSSDQDLKSAYKLRIEKVYLCTGRNGYIPQYDPDGTIYGKGKQYGCIQASRNLQHRFLLLVSRDFSLDHKVLVLGWAMGLPIFKRKPICSTKFMTS